MFFCRTQADTAGLYLALHHRAPWHPLALDPSSPKVAYYRGLEELVNENAQGALSYFQVSLNTLPDWFEAHLGLARAYLGVGNPSGAFFEVNASSHLVETNEQRAAFFYWRATALEALGQVQSRLGRLAKPARPARCGYAGRVAPDGRRTRAIDVQS